MAGCHTHQKRFSAFLDGELTSKKRTVLEDHLAVCAFCRRELAALKGLEQVLDQLEVPTPPAGMSARILAQAKHRQHKNGFGHHIQEWLPAIPNRLWAFKALGSTAVVAFMLFLGVVVGTQGWLPGASENRTAISSSSGLTIEGLEWFAPEPPGSLVSGYLTMTGRHGINRGPHP